MPEGDDQAGVEDAGRDASIGPAADDAATRDPATGDPAAGDPAVEESEPATRTRRSPALAALYGLIGLVVVAVPTVWVATLDSNFAVPDAATADGEEVVAAWRILMAMATAVGMVVVVLLVVAVVTGAGRRTASQTKGSVPLELVYTAVPVLLIGAIFVLSIWLADRMGELTADDDLVVEVDAFRWGWRFTYPDGHQVVGSSGDQDPVLVLPVDRTATLRLHSDDVIHSFFVPAFVTKLDVVPGQDNELRVHPRKVGTFTGHCAEFCGLDHARMNFRVDIVDAAEFARFRAGEP